MKSTWLGLLVVVGVFMIPFAWGGPVFFAYVDVLRELGLVGGISALLMYALAKRVVRECIDLALGRPESRLDATREPR